jgi:hypothetical protein
VEKSRLRIHVQREGSRRINPLKADNRVHICSNNLNIPAACFVLHQFAVVFAASPPGGWKLALILGGSPHLF